MFDSINNILFDKEEDLNLDDVESFTPYMVGRYFSFYSDEYIDYINETLNTYGGLFDGEAQYNYYMNIVPKLKKRRISYMKKPKIDSEIDEGPTPDFYSKKEISKMTDLLPLLTN